MKNLQYILLSIIFGLLSFYCNAQTVYTVTKTTDPDPFVYEYNFDDNLCDPEMYGTLQWAIRKSNDTEGPCEIVFNIQEQAPYIISVNHYFPQITNSVSIDATTQSGYVGGQPAITINGNGEIHYCFSLYNVDNIKISGFNIERFKGANIILNSCSNADIENNIITLSNSTYNQTKVGFSRVHIYNCENVNLYGNTLKTNSEGILTPGPYNYGITIYNTNNCVIGSPEESKSNEIFDCYYGVFLDSSQNIKISANEIYNNTEGISLNYGSNNLKKSPIILSYEGGIISGIGEIGDEIEVFGSTGNENSNEYLGTVTTDENGDWTLGVTPSYDYLITTAKDVNNNTSEFSDAILVSPTCQKPTNLSSTEGVSTSHTLSWDGPTDVAYNVAVGVKDLNPLDDNWMISYSQVTNNSTTIAGLDENTEYEFYINANCGTELSYWAGPFAFNSGILPRTKIIDNLCNSSILYGNPIVAIPLEDRDAYEFVFYTIDSSFNDTIFSPNNIISYEQYYSLPKYEYLNVKVRAAKNNIWNDFGDICNIKIILDCGFDQILKNEIANNSALTQIIEQNIDEITQIASTKDLSTLSEIEIPVVFHVIVPEEVTNAYTYLSPEKIYQSLEALNAVFSKEASTEETAVDTKIRFCPITNYINDPTEPIECEYNDRTYYGITYNFINSEMDINILDENTSNNVCDYYPLSCYEPSQEENSYYTDFPRDQVLNIWIFDELYSSNVCGFAWSDAFIDADIIDDIEETGNTIGYVVVKKGIIGINDTFNRTQGYTLPHEVGHYLGLFHPWDDFSDNDCIEDGDNINDTPMCSQASVSCDETFNTCTGDNENDPIHNIMNYSPDGCRNHFTEDQAEYMHTIIENYYPNLPYLEGAETFGKDCNIPPSLLNANIISPSTEAICMGDVTIEVFCEDATLYTIEIYIDDVLQDNYDGIPNSSSEGSFNYNFSETGSYIIKLILTDEYGHQHTTHSEFEVIECPPIEDGLETAQWHFDNLACLDFSNNIGQLGFSQIHATHSETSVCNSDGELLFYTNGVDVWDYQHNLLTDITFPGNTDISKGIIALKLNTATNPDEYMVLTINDQFKLIYTIISIDDFYDIDIEVYPTLLPTDANIKNEGISACPIPDENGAYWILTSVKNNSTPYPMTIKVNDEIPYFTNDVANMILHDDLTLPQPILGNDYETTIKLSPNGKYVVYQNPRNESKLFFFNAKTGLISDFSCNFENIETKITEAAFSYDSRYLYLSITINDGNTFQIVQFDMNNLDLCLCSLYGNVIFETNSMDDIGYTQATLSLQEGPDKRIYFSRSSDIASNSRNIGIILNPTNAGTASTQDNECNTIDDYIVYDNGSYTYNDLYLPNFVDANPNACELDFRICTEECPLTNEEFTYEIINLSHGEDSEFYWIINDGSDTYQENGVMIPDLDQYNLVDDFSITLGKYTCEVTDEHTISVPISSYEIAIVNSSQNPITDDVICADDQSYIYSLNNDVNNVIWYVNGILYSNSHNIEIIGSDFSGESSISIFATGLNQYSCPFETAAITISLNSIEYNIETTSDCITGLGDARITIDGEEAITYSATIDGNTYTVSNGENDWYGELEPGVHYYTLFDANCFYSGEFIIEEYINITYTLEQTDCNIYNLQFISTDPNFLSYYDLTLTVDDLQYQDVDGGWVISSDNTQGIYIEDLVNGPVPVSVYAENTDIANCNRTYYIILPKTPDIYIEQTIVTPFYCDMLPGSTRLRLGGSLVPENLEFTLLIGENEVSNYTEEYFYSDNDGAELFLGNLESGEYQLKIPYDINGITCVYLTNFVIPDATPEIISYPSYACDPSEENSILLEITTTQSNPIFENVTYTPGGTTILIEQDINFYTTSLNGIDFGTYNFTINAQNGCKYYHTQTLAYTFLSIHSVMTENSCYDESNGTITIHANGGLEPLTYDIGYGPQENNVFNDLESDYYTVSITDANGCSITSNSVYVDENPQIIFTSFISQELCIGVCDGSISINGQGGTGSLNYNWQYNDVEFPGNENIDNLCDGTYSLTITDDAVCTINSTFDIESQDVAPVNPEINIPKCFYINNEFTFTDENNGSDPSLAWTWHIGDEVFVTNENTLNYEFPDYGYYWVSLNVSSNGDCGTESTPAELVFVNPDICACDDDPLSGGDIDYDYPEGIVIGNNGPFILPVQNAGMPQTIRVNGDIVITPTKHLLLEENLTIEFSPGSRMIVMNDAELIIRDNVTLTSISQGSCKDNMWQGIEVWGDPDNPYDYDKQGLVVIEGTVSNNYENVNITNAHIGILLGARNMNHILDPAGNPNPFDESKGSGFILVANADVYFTNNGIGIKFTPRVPMVGVGAFWSGNTLGGSHFKTDSGEELNDDKYSIYTINSYPNPQNPWAGYANPYQRTDVGIYANGIKGLNIVECTFDNLQYGILSYDAKYNVYKSHFTNAIYGIKCENTTSTFLASHEIAECYFDNIPGFLPPANYKLPTAAIHIKAGYNDYIHNNDFGNLSTDQKYNHYGVVTSNSSMFDITENHFRKFNRGIVTTNSGINGGFIGAENNALSAWDGNRFTHSWRSITTQGDNHKLRLKCNTSDNNVENLEEYDVNYLNTGSLANQGGASPLGVSNQKQRYPAGNEFFPEDEESFKRIGSTNTYYTYYYHIGPDAVIPFIEEDNQDYINPNNTNAAFKISNAAACPDPVWGHVVIGIRLPELTISSNNLIMSYPFSIIDSLQNVSDSLTLVRNNLEMNLDDGKTIELLNDIYGSTSAGKLKNKLISCSPLSDTVIHALLTEYPLSHGNFKNVMILNLPVNQSLENLLYSVLTQLPYGIADQLIEMQAYNPFANTPGKLEQEIKNTELEKQLLFNRFTRLLTDTTHNRPEDVILLLESEQNEDADKILAGTYIYLKDYQSAEEKISSIPDINIENEQFIEFNSMLLSYIEQGKSLYAIDSTDLEFIWELAYECPLTHAGANAQSLLSLLFRADFDDCPPAMGTRNVKNYNENFYDNENNADIILGDNYPDPASTYTVIPYKLDDENGILEISDANGKKIAIYELNSGDNEFLLNTQAFAPGIYNYTLICKNAKLITKKLAIYR